MRTDDRPLCIIAPRTNRAALKANRFAPLLLLCLLSALTPWPNSALAENTSKPSRPKIYNESADGSKQIADALVIAKKEGKRVLLQFGANWCGWCHKLHTLFQTDRSIADKLKRDYVTVLIDVNGEHNKNIDTRYGHPARFGLPVLVVLDGDGEQLTTKNTGELEEGDHHNPDKVMTFLKQWAPKRQQ
jgi:thiol:disulfide interchange protein